MATIEADATTQIRLHEADGKLLRAIEDSLTRIRHEEFGLCEECGQPISKSRLKRCPGPDGVGTARDARNLEAEPLTILINSSSSAFNRRPHTPPEWYKDSYDLLHQSTQPEHSR